MIAKKMISDRILAMLLGTILLVGYQQPAKAQDPLISGISNCWFSGSFVLMFSGTWIEAGWYPEVQVIGHVATITQSNAPFVQVFGPIVQANTSIGSVLGSTWAAFSIPGFYTIETLHGYIDDDGTAHESGLSGWGCFL